MSLSRKQELNFRKSHAFVIGINKYPGLSADLETAVQDAEDVALRLKTLQGFDNVLLMNDVGQDQVRALLEWLARKEGTTGTGSSILSIVDQSFTFGEHTHHSRIAWLKLPAEVPESERSQLPILTFSWEKSGTDSGMQEETVYLDAAAEIDIQSGDSILVYYAGHGFPGEVKDGPTGYLSPTDARNELVGNQSLIPMDELYQALSKVKCKHTLLLLDCCFAGKFRFASLSRAGSRPFIQPLYKKRFERYKSSNAWQVLVSAGPEQKAHDSADWANIRNNSPFASVLKEALEGKADLHTFGNKTQGDGIITATELFLYIWNRVEEITSVKKIQHPGLFPMAQHREGEFIFLNPNITSGQFKFAKDPDRNPYKGLLPYQPEDANLFYGRGKALTSLLRKINKNNREDEKRPPVIFLTAPSAAGKSSLAQAGLFPILKKQAAYQELLIFRPTPLQQISGQLVLPDESSFKDEYQGSDWRGISALEALLDPNKRQMILLDQFEEFFTEIPSKNQQEEFEKTLLGLIEKKQKAGAQPSLFVICLQSDVEWQMQQLKTETETGRKEGLVKYWTKNHIFRLQPMDLDELREALTGPAWWAMHDFKNKLDGNYEDNGEELINLILKDVMYYPAALPLLSCIMQRFYEEAQRKRRSLMLAKEDYESLGGVEGAMSTNAQNFYDELPDEASKDLIRKVLIRMVQLGDTGYACRKVSYYEPGSNHNPTSTKQLYELDYGQGTQHLKALIDKMVDAHLLVQGTNGENVPTVEPAHDALVNYWPICRRWIEDFGRDQLLLQRQLWQAVREYQDPTIVPVVVKKEGNNLEQTDYQPSQSEWGFTQLWDTNPKLLQLLEQLSDSMQYFLENTIETEADIATWIAQYQEGEQVKLRQFWQELQEGGNKLDWDAIILSGFSDNLLDLLLTKGKHWMNQAEVHFIQQSWNAKIKGIIELKNQRDIALARAMAGKARQVYNYDHTLALRLAHKAYVDASTIPANPTELEPALQDICSAIHDISSSEDSHFYQLSIETDDIPHCVTCSPNGKYLAVGQQDRKVSIWELETGRWVRDIQGITREVMALAFSPKTDQDPDGGRYLASGGKDRMVKVWDLQEPQAAPVQIPSQRAFGHDISSLAFSPDGLFIAIGTRNGTGTLLYELATGEYKQVGERSNAVAFSHSGKYLAYGNDSNQAVTWPVNWAENWPDIKDQQQIFKHSGDVRSLRFSPDGNYLVTGCDDWNVRLWSLSEGKELEEKRMIGHANAVKAVCYAPDGRHIVSGSDDYTVRIWDVSGEQSQLVKIFKGHKGWVRALAFSPDGKWLISAGHDRTIRIQQFSVTKEIKTFQDKQAPIMDASFFPAGEELDLIVAHSLRSVLWRNSISPSPQLNLLENSTTATVRFSPDGQYYITGGDVKEKEIRIWHYREGQEPQFLQRAEHPNRVLSTAFSHNSKLLLTGSTYFTTAHLFKLEEINSDGEPYVPLDFKHSKKIYSLGFLQDDVHFLTVDQESMVRIWHVDDNQNPVNSFVAHKSRPWGGGATRSLAIFSLDPDQGRYRLLTTHWNGTARIWEGDQLTKNGIPNLIKTLTGHSAGINTGVFSRDGRFVLTGSEDRSVKLWDVRSGAAVQTLSGHRSGLHHVMFSSHDQYILSVDKGRLVKCWNNTMWQLEHDGLPKLNLKNN